MLIPEHKDMPKNMKELGNEPLKASGTILLIEDEEIVLNVNSMVLERLGYGVLKARTGQEAAEIARTFDGTIHLAILDMILPDMKGNELFPLLIKARPNIKVIICSGYSIDGAVQQIIAAGAHGFIQKPFSIATFSEKLAKVLVG